MSLDNYDYDDLVAIQDIIRSAAANSLAIYYARSTADYKADGSIVTEADLAMQLALTTALAADRCFFLPLPLGAGLLVVTTLAQLGVQSGALHLPLEAAERAIETLVVLDDDFQGNRTSRADEN